MANIENPPHFIHELKDKPPWRHRRWCIPPQDNEITPHERGLIWCLYHYLWPNFRGLGGLSVRRDVNIGVTSRSSRKQCMYVWVCMKHPFVLEVLCMYSCPTFTFENEISNVKLKQIVLFALTSLTSLIHFQNRLFDSHLHQDHGGQHP